MAVRPQQLELRPRTWGGSRPGAGRKPSAGRRNVSHRARSAHQARHPIHVTLRAARGLSSLRAEKVFARIGVAFAQASRPDFRLLQFSVQETHVHLLVEADDRDALARGVQGLAIRVAKAVNRALGRRGRVWDDRRYHARALKTPREVRLGLVYVLQNWRKHSPHARGVDPRSSARWFAGWKEFVAHLPGRASVVAARTWLATVGWRRYGLIGVDEVPLTGRRRPRRGSGKTF